MGKRGEVPLWNGEFLHRLAAFWAREATAADAAADGTLANIHLHISGRHSGPRLVTPTLGRRCSYCHRNI